LKANEAGARTLLQGGYDNGILKFRHVNAVIFGAGRHRAATSASEPLALAIGAAGKCGANVGPQFPRIVGRSLARDNPDEGLSMQNERPIGDSPSLRAVTAQIEKLLAANPKATDKARFKMLSKWLEDNPEHQKSVNAYFLTATHQLSFVTPALPTTDIMLKREGGLR
jgi:hypothetical protein